MGEVKLWVNKQRGGDKWTLKFSLRLRNVKDVALHPIGDLLIVSSVDGTVGMVDCYTGKFLRRTYAEGDKDLMKNELNCFRLHPNGKAAI